jgi:hypothetical protein
MALQAGTHMTGREVDSERRVDLNQNREEQHQALNERTVEAIQYTLEAAGIQFIPENGGGPGVRLRKPVGAHAKPAKASPPTPGAKPAPVKKAPHEGQS